MKVNLFTTNFNYNNKFRTAQKFTSEFGDNCGFRFNEQEFEDGYSAQKKENSTEELFKYYEHKSRYRGALAGAMISAMIITLLAGLHKDADTEKTKEFMDDIKEIVTSEDIKNSSLVVTDVNEDGIPDITIVKENGSTIVIDAENKKIIQ